MVAHTGPPVRGVRLVLRVRCVTVGHARVAHADPLKETLREPEKGPREASGTSLGALKTNSSCRSETTGFFCEGSPGPLPLDLS